LSQFEFLVLGSSRTTSFYFGSLFLNSLLTRTRHNSIRVSCLSLKSLRGLNEVVVYIVIVYYVGDKRLGGLVRRSWFWTQKLNHGSFGRTLLRRFLL
jgi:hypothetical protein